LVFRVTRKAGLAIKPNGLDRPRRKLPVATLITHGDGSLPSVRCKKDASNLDACGQVMPVPL
jgi:hypothetical protein